MSAAPTRIVLEIDPAIDPIGGQLSVNGSIQRPFSGWIALTREIQDPAAARHPCGGGDAANTPPTPGEPAKHGYLT